MANKDIELSGTERLIRSFIQHYNHDKYWKYRSIVIDPNRGGTLSDMYRLWYIKRADAFNNASMGTHRNFGAQFATPPHLPHGLNGIVISHNVKIGRNCRIYHQVTIGETNSGAPVIGDDVVIGAGVKIVGGVNIGNRAKIGAGCVIMSDIPDDSIVLAEKPQIILRTKENIHGK